MKVLQERIQRDGKHLGKGVLKVDAFMNHQIDPDLMRLIGEEFARPLRLGRRPFPRIPNCPLRWSGRRAAPRIDNSRTLRLALRTQPRSLGDSGARLC